MIPIEFGSGNSFGIVFQTMKPSILKVSQPEHKFEVVHSVLKLVYAVHSNVRLLARRSVFPGKGIHPGESCSPS